MKPQIVLAVVTAALMAAPVTSPAQSTVQLTVRVPVIVTQLSPDLKVVRVLCNLISDALTNTDPSYPNSVLKYEDITLSAGEAVKVVTMVYNLTLSNPAGKAVRVACWLQGGSEMTSSLNPNSSNPAYRTTSTSVNQVETTFVW